MKKFSQICSLIVLSLLVGYYYCSKNPVSGNNNPTIMSIIAEKEMVDLGETITIRAIYVDIDGDSLNVQWSTSIGVFAEIKGDSVKWKAPDTSGSAIIFLEINDYRGGSDSDSIVINIQNRNPVVSDITITPKNVFLENTAVFKVLASDPDGHQLLYSWSAKRNDKDIGEFFETSGDSVVWIAPSTTGPVDIEVVVSDVNGGKTISIKRINVYSAIGSVWISDTFNNRVVMLSSTGDVLYDINGFFNPEGIDINKNDRTVLVADKGNNRIVKISPDGKIINQILGLDSPHSVSIMSSDGTAWICQDSDSSQVIKISPDGIILRRIHGFVNPLSISVDQKNGSIWVTDTGNDRVVKLLDDIPDGYNINNPPSPDTQKHLIFSNWNNLNFENPVGLTVNSTNGNCWFADKGNNRIVRILGDGSKIDGILGFFSPECVGVNKKNSYAWISDTGNNRVILIKPRIFDSSVPYNISENLGLHEVVPGNYQQPIAVTVNSNVGEMWFTEHHKVVRVMLAGDGKTMSKLEVIGFNTPKGIIVNPGL